MSTGTAPGGNSMAVSQKLKTESPYDPKILGGNKRQDRVRDADHIRFLERKKKMESIHYLEK